MGKKLDCDTPDYHDLHMCKLKKRGLREEMERRSQHPTVQCHKCGARADRHQDICKPQQL